MKPTFLAISLLLCLELNAQTKGSVSPDVIYAQSKGSVVTILTYDPQQNPIAQGSGFVIARDRVITNYHVLAGSSSASIVFNDGSVAVAKSVIAASLPKDIVIVDVATGSRTPLTIGNELDLKVGEPVYAIGAPKGLSASLSNGLVSAFREDEGQFLIQTTAAIAPGSSGGPLFNSQGRVIGVTTSRLKDGGFGFAVGSGDLQRLLRAPLQIAIQLSELPAEDPNPPVDELKPANALAKEKKYSEALALLRKTSQEVQTSYDGQFLQCQLQQKLSEYEAAIQACDAAIRLKPSSAEAYGEKALVLYGSGDLNSSETIASQATKLSSDSYYAALLGLIYYSEEKFTLVPNQISPESKDTFELTLLEGAALRNGNSELFQSTKKRVTEIKGDNNGWQLYFEGTEALRNFNYDVALDKFRKCDADDDFIDAACIISTAGVEITKGDRDSAKSDIDIAVNRFPRGHSVLYQAIFIDLMTGNAADAKRIHQRLEALSRQAGDESSDCLYYYGVNQASDATSHCAEAIKNNGDAYVAWSNPGYVALDNRQFQTAFSYFKTAMDKFNASKDKHTGAQELDVSWGLITATYYAGDKKDAKVLYRIVKKAYPHYTTMIALKQLPLLWSDATQELISKVITTFD